jgi:hypothetical protein
MSTAVEMHINEGANTHLAIKEALAFANQNKVEVDLLIDGTILTITEDSEIDDLLEEFENYNTI